MANCFIVPLADNGVESKVFNTLYNVEDGIAFNVFHEGLHLGAILSLFKKIVK